MSSVSQPAIKNPEVRLQIVQVLTKLPPAQALEKLLPLLIDLEESVRVATGEALEKVDPQWHKSEAAKRAMPFFEQAAHDDNYWVGLAAVDVLKKISADSQPPTAETKAEKTTITDRYYHERREAARLLASALKDHDADFRLVAAEALGRIGNVGFADSLAPVLQDGDEWVRWHAAKSLASMQWQPSDEKQKAAFSVILANWDEAVSLGEHAVAPLLLALKSSQSHMREAAAMALGKLKDARGELPLADCLSDKNKAVRRAAAKALVAIGPKQLTADHKNLMVAELRA